MSSTYSTSLRIQLIDTGTELEAWGDPTDNNLGTIIEQAIVGSNTISLTNLTSYTLTTANATVDQSRNAVLVFNGALTANCNVIAPSVQKVYVVSNQTTGGKFVKIKTATGNAVSVINGTNQLVYCNGTDFISAVNINIVVGNIAISGNSSVGGNVTVGSNVVISNSITGTSGNLSLISTASNTVNFQGATGALIPPSGTTAERPATPRVGMSRWNTTVGWYEIWNGTSWQQITGSFNVNYLIVAGGGGGGYWKGGGGGGAGGVLSGSVSIAGSQSYSITVGSGGSSTTQGSNSSAFSLIAIGGGYGAGQFGTGSYTFSGGSGGSGGGAIDWTNGGGSAGSVGSGTSGQGYAGGLGGNGNGNGGNAAGGGGGAGAVGGAGTSGGFGNGGAGGAGMQSSITGTATYYGGGGGGGLSRQYFSTGFARGGAGGAGGGGTGGGSNPDTAGVSGTANTGGGGGGSGENYTTQTETGAGSGGSGVVILSYVNPVQRATGGTVTSYVSGGNTYWVHRFTTSGTFVTT